jgi:hypothetical protein
MLVFFDYEHDHEQEQEWKKNAVDASPRLRTFIGTLRGLLSCIFAVSC